MVVRAAPVGIYLEGWHVFCFTQTHFHGQMPRDTRAEIGRQGSIRVPGQEAKTAPSGAPSFFVISISSQREIWRPAVSGTGGIQDDRIAGRQKLLTLTGYTACAAPRLREAIIAPFA